jgi:hypothetical protein
MAAPDTLRYAKIPLPRIWCNSWAWPGLRGSMPCTPQRSQKARRAWSRNQPALLCPMVTIRRPSRASSRPAWHHPPGPPVRVLECRRPAGMAFRASSAPQNAKPNCANDPKGYGHRTPPPSAPAPAAVEQRHAPANPTTKLFSCARMTRTAPTRPPQPFNSSSRRTKPTRPSDRNAPKLPPSLQSENPRTGRGWRDK